MGGKDREGVRVRGGLRVRGEGVALVRVEKCKESRISGMRMRTLFH